MSYLIKKAGRYYYNRRVPESLKEFDPRDFVRVALKTDSKDEAIKRARIQNDQIEKYWKELVDTGKKYEHDKYREVVRLARLLGFSYMPSHQLANEPLDQIAKRIHFVERKKLAKPHVEAVLGGAPAPALKLDDALQRFWDFAKDKTLNKSANQIRKWENPREKAIKNFMSVVGNKRVPELSRDDALQFRDWWIDRLEEKELKANTANKDLIHVKTIIETVNENMSLGLDTVNIFKNLLLPEEDAGTKLPFESSYIIFTLLNPEKLAGLNEQAKWFLYAFSETGVGLTEATGLRPEDIVLDADIPYIKIIRRKGQMQKTKYRVREIPLVGYALDAYKACPHGFTDYGDRPDALSAVLGSYLREKKLLPTPNHTVNSLRHSFQDRLLAANTPDRIQADLMGHKFERPKYGEGPTLAHKLQWLEMIQLKK